jgi:hypothetical protein
MEIKPITMSSMLSASLNLNTDNIKFLITTDSSYNIQTLADITSGTIDFTTANISKEVVSDIGAYSSTKGVYLSAENIFFSNIDKDYSELGINYIYIYAYKDTGTPATSIILARHQIYNYDGYGPTRYVFTNQIGSRFLSLVDRNTTSTLYRPFREGLFKCSYGNMRTKNIKFMLLDSSYSFDITDSTYADIPSGSIISEASVDQSRLYISSDGSLAISGSNILLFNTPSVRTVNSVVMYIDEAPLNKPLIGYNSSLNKTNFSTNSTTTTFRINGNILFSL